jgi:hypothetical protein
MVVKVHCTNWIPAQKPVMEFFENTAIKLYVCTKLSVAIWGGEANLDFHVGTRTVAH